MTHDSRGAYLRAAGSGKLLFAWRVSLEEKKNCTDTAKSTGHLTGAFCLVETVGIEPMTS